MLEMDHEENRLYSFLSLYAHISKATNAICEMKGALWVLDLTLRLHHANLNVRFKKDLPQLRSLCEDLHLQSKALGMYRISESCEEIIKRTEMDKEDWVRVDERDALYLYVDNALTSLEASVASARTALDAFYAAA